MIPTGYTPHDRRSPLTAPWEPLYSRSRADGSVDIAVEIRDVHCNSRGFVHGGLICALADNAMGLSAVMHARPATGQAPASAVTVSLTVDFIGVARIGDTLEIRPNVLRSGRSLAFVDCKVVCADKLIARANATFRYVSGSG